MDAETFARFLRKQGACSEGYEFAMGKTLREAWASCREWHWLAWILFEVDYESYRFVTACTYHLDPADRVDAIRRYTNLDAVERAIMEEMAVTQ